MIANEILLDLKPAGTAHFHQKNKQVLNVILSAVLFLQTYKHASITDDKQ